MNKWKWIHLIRLREESKMMFRTWNHLAWRRAARASRHFCLSKTSAGSFTILEVTSKNGSNCQMMERNGCLTRSERFSRTHCHTYQTGPLLISQMYKLKTLSFHPMCRIVQIFSTTLWISNACHWCSSMYSVVWLRSGERGRDSCILRTFFRI